MCTRAPTTVTTARDTRPSADSPGGLDNSNSNTRSATGDENDGWVVLLVVVLIVAMLVPFVMVVRSRRRRQARKRQNEENDFVGQSTMTVNNAAYAPRDGSYTARDGGEAEAEDEEAEEEATYETVENPSQNPGKQEEAGIASVADVDLATYGVPSSNPVHYAKVIEATTAFSGPRGYFNLMDNYDVYEQAGGWKPNLAYASADAAPANLSNPSHQGPVAIKSSQTRNPTYQGPGAINSFLRANILHHGPNLFSLQAEVGEYVVPLERGDAAIYILADPVPVDPAGSTHLDCGSANRDANGYLEIESFSGRGMKIADSSA